MGKKLSPALPLIVGLTLFSLLVVLQGCSASSSTRRGPLSDAMDKASDDNEGDRTVESTPRYGYGTSDVESGFPWIAGMADSTDSANYRSASSPPLEVRESDSTAKKSPFWGSAAFSTGYLAENAFSGFHHINLLGGAYSSKRTRLEGVLGIGYASVKENDPLSKSLYGGILILNAGGQIRWYTTPQYTALGHYFLGGVAYNYMAWSYKHSIQSGGSTIGSDGLFGYEFYLGTGINIIQSRYVQLGLELLPGVIIWEPSTTEGFDNDVFDPFVYTKLRFIMSFSTGS